MPTGQDLLFGHKRVTAFAAKGEELDQDATLR